MKNTNQNTHAGKRLKKVATALAVLLAVVLLAGTFGALAATVDPPEDLRAGAPAVPQAASAGDEEAGKEEAGEEPEEAVPPPAEVAGQTGPNAGVQPGAPAADDVDAPKEDRAEDAAKAPAAAKSNTEPVARGARALTMADATATSETELRDALAATAGDVAIELGGNIELEAPVEIDTGRIVTLTSAGAATLTVKGEYRHFNVTASGAQLHFSGVTLDGGKVGGGIDVGNAQDVVLHNATIQNCHALRGGAVRLAGSTLRLEGATLTDNVAYAAGISGQGNGGGVHMDAASALTFGGTVKIENNKAVISGGGIYVTNGNPNELVVPSGVSISHNNCEWYGAGVFMGNHTRILIEGGKIDYNESLFDGGGVNIEDEATLVMRGDESSISYNKAITGAGISGSYAVIANTYEVSAKSYVELRGGHVSHNRARTVAGVDRHSAGAGVYAYSVLVENAHLDENTVEQGYAAAINAAHVKFHGGTMNKNFVEKAFSPTNYVSGTTVRCYTFEMTSGEITGNDYGKLDNKSDLNSGNPVPNTSQVLHGTVCVDVNPIKDITWDTGVSNLSISGGSISGNRSYNGGAVALSRFDAISSQYNTTNIPNLMQKAVVNISGGTFENNTSTKERLGTNSGGGAFYLDIWPATFSGDVKITGNTTTCYGGGIFKAGKQLTISDNVVIDHNTAGGSGGGVYMTANTGIGDVDVNVSGDVAVTNNKAVNGGGLYINCASSVKTGAIQLKDNVVVAGNLATTHGGGVHLGDSGVNPLKILTVGKDVTFAENEARFAMYPNVLDEYKAIHATNIKTPTLTEGYGFEYLYNNCDVFYIKGGQFHVVAFKYNLPGRVEEVFEQRLVENGALILQPDPAPTAPGYTFKGEWYTGPECKPNQKVTLGTSYKAYGKEVLYASWDALEYHITYLPNGGTGSQEDTTAYTYNSPAEILDRGTLAKEGHTFTGWNTAADGKGTAYTVGCQFNLKDNLTLYAQYAPNEYDVTFVYGLPGMQNEVRRVPYGEKIPQPTAPTHPAYNFEGWYTSGGDKWDFENGTMPLDGLALTARWEKKAFTVHYQSDGVAFDTREVVWGEPVPDLTPPAKAGYTFKHWLINGEENAVWNMAQDTMPQQDLVLEAFYTKNAPPTPPPASSSKTGPTPRPVSSSSQSQVTPPAPAPSQSTTPPPAPRPPAGTNSRSTAPRLPASSRASSAAPAPSSSAARSASSAAVAAQSATAASSAAPTSLAEAERDTQIGQTGVPLFQPGGFRGGWSLFNLFAMVLSVLFTAIMLVRTLAKRGSKQTVEEAGEAYANTSQTTNRAKAFRVVAVVAALITVVLFAITQNIFATMTWFDTWSAAFLLLAVVQVLFSVMGRGKKENDDDDDQYAYD